MDNIFPDASFEIGDVPTIQAPGDHVVANGMPAQAMFYGAADKWQANLMAYGAGNASYMIDDFPTSAITMVAYSPPFATRAAVGVLAMGDGGDVTIGGSYTINVTNTVTATTGSLTGALVYWGSKTDLFTITASSGAFKRQLITVVRPADVKVICVFFQWLRHQTAI